MLHKQLCRDVVDSRTLLRNERQMGCGAGGRVSCVTCESPVAQLKAQTGESESQLQKLQMINGNTSEVTPNQVLTKGGLFNKIYGRKK